MGADGEFKQLVPPSTKKPKTQWAQTFTRRVLGNMRGGQVALIRDQLSLSSWLALGACFQSLLFLAVGARPSVLLPAFLLLAYRLASALAMANGLTRNTYMDNVIQKKFSAQIPDASGRFPAKPSAQEVCVFLIGTRCNHPLGMLAPNFRTVGAYFVAMHKDAEVNADKWGLLGSSSWVSMGERDTGNELLIVMYFKNADYLHAFARGSEAHMDGWNWWNKHLAENSHISIWHETYQVPASSWETIYVNSHPTLLGGSMHKREVANLEKDNGSETVWISPIVDASKGAMRTSAGRMSRGTGREHDKFENFVDPYTSQ
ncbi:hypothetical protein BDY21DRAFT_370442 [Lineolata rhizophorae]|uniref:DUF4188 domain-containing protein n=1 Tax=Lineolata rhizophorae TaxID=578093 RepID=A0A6A6P659_9PEZI|nr:hypothetical protein BDY21DRAFT_370442 [Lineolata rhizophorae]